MIVGGNTGIIWLANVFEPRLGSAKDRSVESLEGHIANLYETRRAVEPELALVFARDVDNSIGSGFNPA